MTVLFMSDWEDQGAIPDWDTKNESFVHLALLYKEMGVENYAFILALHDQGLKNVNPFDKNISQEMAERVGLECKVNFWYYIREIARDPAGSDDYPIRFRANRGVISAYWLFFNHVLVILIMIRQTGKSFGIDWLVNWILNIGTTKAEVSYLGKDEKLRTRELERLKAMELTVPKYLKQRSNKDAGNTEVLRVGFMENTFKAYVPNKSPKLADLIGRGMTAQTVVCDEFAYCANNMITIPVMLSATLAAREVARMKNEPYGTIFMTTSGKRDTPEGRYAYKFVSNAAVFTEMFFNCPDVETLYEMIKKCGDGKNIRVNCTFNHRQLGKSDQWLKDRLAEAAQEDPIAIKADYLNEWPSGAMFSPLTPEVMEIMRASEKLDYVTRIDGSEAYAFRWYYEDDTIDRLMANTHHFLGCDPSEMVGRDAVGMVLRNIVTGGTAMVADISEGNIINYMRWLGYYLKNNPKVTLIIERKNTGSPIIDYLLDFLPGEGIDPFTRIYNQVVQYADENQGRFQECQNALRSRDNVIMRYKRLFGWSTSSSGATARSDLFSRTLTNAATISGCQMYDRKLILQTVSLEIRNGRVDHQEGEHDDLTVSWLLTHWLMTHGRNLHHYGVNSSTILTNNPKQLESLKSTTRYEQHVNMEARRTVERLTEALRTEEDEYIARRMELDLERAVSQLCEQDRKIVSLDDLINKLREERTQSYRAAADSPYQVTDVDEWRMLKNTYVVGR